MEKEQLYIGQIVLAPRSGKYGQPKTEAKVIGLRNRDWPYLEWDHEIEGQDHYQRKVERSLLEPIKPKFPGAAS